MERILDVAQYLIQKYKEVTAENIDEMKLHKLLYFAQRESIAVTGHPMFYESLEGWKFGPVSPEVRFFFSPDGIVADTNEIDLESAYILNNVIFEYGAMASWKLSELSHKEKSWLNARTGLDARENGQCALALSDIRDDAKKVRPYDHIWDMYYDEFEDISEEIDGL